MFSAREYKEQNGVTAGLKRGVRTADFQGIIIDTLEN